MRRQPSKPNLRRQQSSRHGLLTRHGSAVHLDRSGSRREMSHHPPQRGLSQQDSVLERSGGVRELFQSRGPSRQDSVLERSDGLSLSHTRGGPSQQDNGEGGLNQSGTQTSWMKLRRRAIQVKWNCSDIGTSLIRTPPVHSILHQPSNSPLPPSLLPPTLPPSSPLPPPLSPLPPHAPTEQRRWREKEEISCTHIQH